MSLSNQFGVPGFWVPRGLLDDYRHAVSVEIPSLRKTMAKQSSLIIEQEKLITQLEARDMAISNMMDDLTQLVELNRAENQNFYNLRDAAEKQARATRRWQIIAASSGASIIAVLLVAASGS